MTREETNITIDYLKEMQEGYIEGEGYERHPLPEWYALDKAIKAIEQESILDKVRAEIMTLRNSRAENYDLPFEYENFDERIILMSDVLEILDKLKAESENK